MNELALFAGAGGGILGGHLLGWRTVCAVEYDSYAAAVLCQRQNDGFLPAFPIWDDVRTFDGRPWRGIVDVVSGGFPCQDISAAGTGAGLDGERSGLWVEMARIIGEVRPGFCFVENSPVLTSRGLGRVLGDLAAMGYDAEWGVLGAADVGAPHQRDRIWIMAYSSSEGAGSVGRTIEADRWRNAGGDESPLRQAHRQNGPNRPTPAGQTPREVADAYGQHDDNGRPGASQVLGFRQPPSGLRNGEPLADPRSAGLETPEQESVFGAWRREQRGTVAECSWWSTEPGVGRVADGVASRVDRLRCIGNGQVPRCAAEAWRRLLARV